MQSVNWAWGLSLTALTIAIHTMGVVMMAVAGLRIKARLGTRVLGFWHAILVVIGVVGTAGLLLAVLHGIEAAIWAAAYVWLGALNLPNDAILYSVDSMTTRGASGLMLEQHWRMMGALEAANGMLLFGISTAYIFRGDAGVLVDALRSAHDPPSNPLAKLPTAETGTQTRKQGLVFRHGRAQSSHLRAFRSGRAWPRQFPLVRSKSSS